MPDVTPLVTPFVTPFVTPLVTPFVSPEALVRISVVIPAWNAADTLARALDSLLAQTMGEWEAIVVDDGSTDSTSDVVRRHAAADQRIRLVRQENAGLSAARNAGIRNATHPWLHFLDADDWMAPTAFARFAEVLSADPTLDAVHCGWARVAADGTVIAESRCWQDGDLFEHFAVRCAFAVHACLVRRTKVEEAGLFDSSIRITQDWMLWQRIARRGARFGAVADTLAYYTFRADSLSSDPFPLLNEALAIMAVGHGRDPQIPDAVHMEGRPHHELAAAQLHYVCWVAGVLIGRGEDAVPLLARLPRPTAPPAPVWIAESLVRAVPHSLGMPSTAWPAWWPSLAPGLQRFLDALESHIGIDAFAHAVRIGVERSVAPLLRGDATTLGLYHVVEREVTAPMPLLTIPRGVERLGVNVMARGEWLGLVELPVVDGQVCDVVLRDAMADALAWPILGRFFAETIYRAWDFTEAGGRCSAWHAGVQLADDLPCGERARLVALHDAVGWGVFLREVWAGADASDAVRTPPAVPNETEWNVVESSDPAWHVNVLGGRSLIALQVGGSAIAAAARSEVGELGEVGNATSLHTRLSDLVGFELCRVAVREGLLGSSWDDEATLSQRLAWKAAQRPDGSTKFEISGGGGELRISYAPGSDLQVALADPGESAALLLARRAHRSPGGSAARFHALPSALVQEIVEVETIEGTPMQRRDQRSDAGGLYVPSLLWHREQRAEGVAPSPERPRNEWSPPAAPRPNDADTIVMAPGHTPQRLPILMYHRVAPDGAPDRLRWRVSPAAFEAQMLALAEHGYHTVTLQEWKRSLHAHAPLRSRPVVITFDDGYVDFADFAWPILRRHAFGALAFIVAGSVGRWNTWDVGGEGEPLMDWNTLRRLRDEGLTFGAHSVTHRRLTALAPNDMFAEALRSRRALMEALGESIDTFAFPFGDEDPVVRHVIGAAGFEFGLSVRSGAAHRNAPWLSLPRIEITGEDSIASFVAKLES